jgi:hypothetical protein
VALEDDDRALVGVEAVERVAVGGEADRRVFAPETDARDADHAAVLAGGGVALHQAVALRREEVAVGGAAGVHRV